jgi:hypothetical protein
MFVCQYFRTLAQPSFFRLLAVKPFSIDGHGRFARHEDDINWIRQKLEFYSSPTIARHVQFCRISPHHLAQEDPNLRSNDVDSGLPIMDAVFELLPQFLNLREVDLTLVHLTDSNMRQISRILRLDTILLRDCRLMATTSIRLTVQTVLLSRSRRPFLHDTSTLLPSLLQSNRVKCLCIMGGPWLDISFHMSRMLPLHCLCTLCIHHSALISFLPCLPRLPALLELMLHTHDTSSPVYPCPSSLPPHNIPLLETYDGPLHHIRCFAQGRPVRHLRLWGMTAGDIVLNHLLALNSTADLESLEFYVNEVNESLLTILCDKNCGFPKIKALSIKFDYMDHKVGFCRTPFNRSNLVISDLDPRTSQNTTSAKHRIFQFSSNVNVRGTCNNGRICAKESVSYAISCSSICSILRQRVLMEI